MVKRTALFVLILTVMGTIKFCSMDKLRQLQNLAWCKPDWCLPSTSKETNELLRQCAELDTTPPSDDIDELIARSKAFPVPFPIQTVRLEQLKERVSIEELKRNIASTYPLVHERVLLLMTHFLIYKREFGNSIEKAFYKDMTVPELLDRILQKRAVVFMGPKDQYQLLNGEKGQDGWETIGTLSQKPPLTLDNCLSYDEIKISAMVYMSGRTVCINNGNRHNEGVVNEKDVERDAVIIGTIGPRFERTNRMDFEDILVTESQNCPDNGYGEEVTPTTCLNVLKTTYVRNNQSAKHMWRQMWSEFYQVPSYTYTELSSYINTGVKAEERLFTDRFIQLPAKSAIFDNEVYYKRIVVLAESVLIEAEARAREAGRQAFVNVIGCGLGVWKVSNHQNDVYVLTFVERIRALLRTNAIPNVTDVNFAYIKISNTLQALFKNTTENNSEDVEMRIFVESKKHPKGGINIQFENREPSSRLSGDHAGKLLVMTFPWDGNAHPGNEFWLGSLSGSGDPAAAASTQISELHNAHVNTGLRSEHTRIVAPPSLIPLQTYCRDCIGQ